jgi:hypothetical protein
LAAKNQSQLAKAELDRLERTIQEIGQFGQLAEEELANGRQNVGQTGQLGTEIGQIGKVLPIRGREKMAILLLSF